MDDRKSAAHHDTEEHDDDSSTDDDILEVWSGPAVSDEGRDDNGKMRQSESSAAVVEPHTQRPCMAIASTSSNGMARSQHPSTTGRATLLAEPGSDDSSGGVMGVWSPPVSDEECDDGVRLEQSESNAAAVVEPATHRQRQRPMAMTASSTSTAVSPQPRRATLPVPKRVKPVGRRKPSLLSKGIASFGAERKRPAAVNVPQKQRSRSLLSKRKRILGGDEPGPVALGQHRSTKFRKPPTKPPPREARLPMANASSSHPSSRARLPGNGVGRKRPRSSGIVSLEGERKRPASLKEAPKQQDSHRVSKRSRLLGDNDHTRPVAVGKHQKRSSKPSAKKKEPPPMKPAPSEAKRIKKKKVEELEIGSHVKAEYSNGGWYCGTIINVVQSKTGPKYTIMFFEHGEVLEGVSRSEITTADDYKRMSGSEIDEPPPEHLERLEELRQKQEAKQAMKDRLKKITQPLSLEELEECKCEDCVNCLRDDCGKCATCRSRIPGVRAQLCLQKICCEVPFKCKVQPMPPTAKFPPGWSFLFDPTYKDGSYVEKSPLKGAEGLRIVPPKGYYTYYSVEGAQRHRTVELRRLIAPVFYRHVGIDTDHDAKIVPVYASASRETKKAAVKVERGRDDRIVGSRVYCELAGGRCWATLVGKMQIAHKKWRFAVQRDGADSLELLDESQVMGAAQFKSRTGNDPPQPPITETSDSVGTDKPSALAVGRDLIGTELCFRWNDLNHSAKTVRGKVTGCSEQADGVAYYEVTYTPESRRLANSLQNGCGVEVPESQMRPLEWVLGGCALSEQESLGHSEKSSQYDHFHYWSWITALRYHEEMVSRSDGSRLPPILTLELRGCRLEVSAEESTIPDAGVGLFLRCWPLKEPTEGETPRFLVLKAGELVDLGIYAPRCPLHLKALAVFYVKNFIHSHECEEWAFNASDGKCWLDITDDLTGEIDASRLLQYVNETDDDTGVTIKAVYDPEGCLHFLLGHPLESQGCFVVPTDGSRIELFVNYGVGYEKVRVRKGYSFLSDFERNGVLELLRHEDARNLKEMDESFGKPEIAACFKFLLDVFRSGDKSKCTPKKTQRALLCAVVLQRKVTALPKSRARSGSSVAKLEEDAAALVSLLLDLSGDDRRDLKELQSAGKFKEVLKRVFKLQEFTAEDMETLSYMIED